MNTQISEKEIEEINARLEIGNDKFVAWLSQAELDVIVRLAKKLVQNNLYHVGEIHGIINAIDDAVAFLTTGEGDGKWVYRTLVFYAGYAHRAFEALRVPRLDNIVQNIFNELIERVERKAF